MSYPIIIQPEAELDFEDAYCWYEHLLKIHLLILKFTSKLVAYLFADFPMESFILLTIIPFLLSLAFIQNATLKPGKSAFNFIQSQPKNHKMIS